ncbi:nucleotide disphospho-sugar-binding domain-containing protein [Streptomyces iconiensis]|uniref:DUF1205 domain-containing protein n=1 Tax=Streptomyces iconiensis TaxID=1384038 RepID=A0ABT7A6A8_9ACTN|nr:nucleotide disphospho-sugar-binding domain-containing protein [Streptomyces iconiensis]MDJ1136880.1 DUF1205 domain-containing protein [Streptomyces iconiensis]
MRILFTTFPWKSHYWTMVPTIWACRAAGHEVIVASTPSLIGTITGSGVPAAAVGRDIDLPEIARSRRLAAWHDHERWPADYPAHPERLTDGQRDVLAGLAELQVAMAEAMVGGLVSLARRWRPDLVVHNTVTLAGPVAAEVMEVPSVSHHWGGPGLHQIEMRGLGTEPLPAYARLFERYETPVRTAPGLWIDMCPPSLQLPTSCPRAVVGYVPYNGTGQAPDWAPRPSERPRVCVTWGETTMRLLGQDGLRMFRAAVDAVAGLDAELVIATTEDQRAALGELPPGARVLTSVPLHLIAPTCHAVVHHAGSGTLLTSARAGVPQLTITRRPEPTLAGERLVGVGAGRHLRHDELAGNDAATEVIRADVEKLLTEPAYRKAAERLREEMARQPGPAAVVPVLETLADGTEVPVGASIG